jgi:hypothetical protein
MLTRRSICIGIKVLLTIGFDFTKSKALKRVIQGMIVEEMKEDKIQEELTLLKRKRFIFKVNVDDKTKKHPFVAAFIMFQTRGLTRCMLENFLKTKLPVKFDFISAGRLELLKFIVLNMNIFRKEVLEHIFFTKEDFIGEVTFLKQENFLGPTIPIMLSGNQTYEFSISSKLEHVRPGLLDSLRIRNSSLILSILIWDIGRFREMLSGVGLQNEVFGYIEKNNSEIFEVLDNKRCKKIEMSSQADLSFDDYESKNLNGFALFNELEIWHKFLLVHRDRLLITDITASPYQKFVSGSWPFVKLRKRSQYCEVQRPAAEFLIINCGIVLTGRNDTNWFHFLLDTLPKVLFISNIPDHVPILVDSDIPVSGKKILESLTDREIVYIEKSQSLKVKTAYVMSCRGAIFDTKPKHPVPRTHLSPRTYSRLATLIKSKMSSKGVPKGSEEFSLMRTQGVRALQNQSEVIKCLRDNGIMVFHPNPSFFEYQLELFSNAKLFVGLGGSAIANVIFMSKNSKVLVLENVGSAKVGLWRDLCEGLGLSFSRVEGVGINRFRKNFNNVHANFKIEISALETALRTEKSDICTLFPGGSVNSITID